MLLKWSTGKPKERVPGQKPPCRRCPKIPLDDPPFWRYAVELSDRNRMALRHYYQCRATGRWPDDKIVTRNAGIIEATLEECRDDLQRETRDTLATFLSLGMRRNA